MSARQSCAFQLKFPLKQVGHIGDKMVDKAFFCWRTPPFYQRSPILFQAQHISHHYINILDLFLRCPIKRLQQILFYAIPKLAKARNQGQRNHSWFVGLPYLLAINIYKQGLVAQSHFVCYDVVHVVELLMLVVFQAVKIWARCYCSPLAL